jgi:signal peptidase I
MGRAARIAYVFRIVVLALTAFAVLRFMWTYKTVRVPEWNDQMEPTLEPGERLLVHRGMVRAGAFGRGEMIVYAVSSSEGVSLRFGRVAGVPGDEVRLSDVPGREVLVNGQPATYAPTLQSAPGGGSRDAAPRPVTVPECALYVVNDNLFSRLSDSRRLGPVTEAAFAGKVVMSLNR